MGCGWRLIGQLAAETAIISFAIVTGGSEGGGIGDRGGRLEELLVRGCPRYTVQPGDSVFAVVRVLRTRDVCV